MASPKTKNVLFFFFFFFRVSHNKENIIWGSIFWVPYVGILPIPRRVHVPDNGFLEILGQEWMWGTIYGIGCLGFVKLRKSRLQGNCLWFRVQGLRERVSQEISRDCFRV